MVFGTSSHLLFGIEAAYLLTGSELDKRRFLLHTLLRCIFAPRCELAALRERKRVRDNTGDRFELVRDIVYPRDTEHQPFGIRMAHRAIREDYPRGCLFDDLTAIHDDNIIRHFVDNAEVVRDEDYRGAVFALEIVHQAEYLRLDGNVERRCRFVRDKYLLQKLPSFRVVHLCAPGIKNQLLLILSHVDKFNKVSVHRGALFSKIISTLLQLEGRISIIDNINSKSGSLRTKQISPNIGRA